MRGAAVAKDVDAYLKAAPATVRPLLMEMRAMILKTAPKAEEGISYGMPYYKLNGPLCGFALFKSHIGFFPGAIVNDFAEDLAGYKTSKGTVQLSLDKPLPATLIRKILKAGMARNAAAKKPQPKAR
ncbi:MAG TPA: DUF1801 domain-containing protein [Rhizomicrobium sp.]|jgi:uncharacterized protein YdhG (YjbR/CyaY superfamily)|nr:DUF1801 domain-containing protein [Rhizomicrobium sp.]